MQAVLASRDVAAALPEDESARVRLASRGDTPAEVLHLLASDPAVVVRAAVAMNPVCGASSNGVLAGDTDERVRALLAEKVARLLPQLSGNDRTDALAHAHETLTVLAADAAARVRNTLSDVLAAMPEAPRGVILALAHDRAARISDPVLRLSPLLTDSDLLGLLAAPPHPQAACAVAQRPRVSVAVSDAIAARADAASIRLLLQNPCATIRESTLDGLIGRAGDHPDWHEPLVRRPWLAERASRALSLIVTEQLLEALLARHDISDNVAHEIRTRLQEGERTETDDEGMVRLRRSQGAVPVREAALAEAAASADYRRMRMLLALAADVPLAQLDRALATRNAKAMISLVWRAGFSMHAGRLVQSMLGTLSPSEILAPAMHGAFPLCVQEMEWQLEHLGEPVRA